MPVISLFYGIAVLMYYYDTKQHNVPHIHVQYGEYEAVISIPEGNLLEGSLPNNKMKLVFAWIEIHKEDLAQNWNLAINGEKPFRIEPLK